MKRLKKQIEREFGKLEAATYPCIKMSDTAKIILSISYHFMFVTTSRCIKLYSCAANVIAINN